MDILLKPDSLSLSGSMKRFLISASNDVSFVLKYADTNDTIIGHTYTPNKEGVIEIDMERIISPLLSFRLQDVGEPYRQTEIVRNFTAVIREKTVSESVTWTFTVLRAGIDRMSDSAENFLRQNFLTWQPNMKAVTYYTPEFLTYYAPVAAVVKVKAYFEGTLPKEITLTLIPAGECWTVPVQYAVIAGKCDGKLPLYYDVWVENTSGERMTYIQRYYAGDMKSEQEQWILFENSLGGIDTFRAYGDSEFSAEHTHNIAEIDEGVEEYRVDTTRKWKKHTGHLDGNERQWLLDFFPSPGKYIYTGAYLRRIVVTESDVDYTAKELPSDYQFTYRYTESRPYLNIPRTDIPHAVMNIQVPDVGSFTIAPRLVEFPRLTLSGGALFPVQNPYSENWGVTSADALLNYLVREITEAYKGDGSFGHSHTNMSLLDALGRAGLYLLLNGQKVSAGFADLADKARNLSEDSEIWKKFLRKDIDDVARGLLTMVQGLKVGDGTHGIDSDGNAVLESLSSAHFKSGLMSGTGWKAWTDDYGKSNIEVDKLLVRMKAVFAMLEIRKISNIGGDFTMSRAGSTLYRVVRKSDGWRCYLLADDGTTRTMNEWRMGDQAMCRTFNVKSGVYENVANKYYFRLVTAAGEEMLEDGKTYHYVDLSDVRGLVDLTDEHGVVHHCIGYDMSVENDVPQIDDAIVQRGSQTDPERQSLIDLSVSECAITLYAGVNDYDVASHAVMRLSPQESYVYSNRFEVKSYADTSVSSPIVCHRGAWVSGRLYGHYDAVTHAGSQWLCIVGKGHTTTEEPSDTSSVWLKQVRRGDDGLTLTILTDRGNIIRNGQGEVTLTAVLMRGKEDVTAEYPTSAFSWSRESGHADFDQAWNDRHRGVGRTITVNAEDVFRKANFDCIISE